MSEFRRMTLKEMPQSRMEMVTTPQVSSCKICWAHTLQEEGDRWDLKSHPVAAILGGPGDQTPSL